MLENIVVIGAVVLMVLAAQSGWLDVVLSKLNLKRPQPSPNPEPDSDANSNTPLLDILEKLLSQYVDMPKISIMVQLLRRLIRQNPQRAREYVEAQLPIIQEELAKAQTERHDVA